MIEEKQLSFKLVDLEENLPTYLNIRTLIRVTRLYIDKTVDSLLTDQSIKTVDQLVNQAEQIRGEEDTITSSTIYYYYAVVSTHQPGSRKLFLMKTQHPLSCGLYVFSGNLKIVQEGDRYIPILEGQVSGLQGDGNQFSQYVMEQRDFNQKSSSQ